MKNVIIIGSGIGGLIAGNLLAKKGHKVTIFEAHSMPGGYTAGFYKKGYYFESGTLSFEASASVFKAMKDIGVFEQIEFSRQRLRLVSEDFDVIPENYDDYKKRIYDGFPSEKEKLDTVFSVLDETVSLMGNVDEPMPFLFSGLEMVKSVSGNYRQECPPMTAYHLSLSNSRQTSPLYRSLGTWPAYPGNRIR